jgi:hypothetical protein
LCTGTTLLLFRGSGKMPVDKLRLKICERGKLISIAIFFSNLVLRPSMSELDLLSKDCMMLAISAGLVQPI